MSIETTIKLCAAGTLVLVLPGKDGTIHEIDLQVGQVEKILLTLLAEQHRTPAVGKNIGPSWKFLLESGLLAGKIVKLPQGASGAHKTLVAKKTSEELGL